MLEITQESFEKEVAKSDKLVVIDFWAPWCGPCQKFGPVFEEVIEEYKDKVKGAKVNIEEQGEFAKSFSIMSIPCLIFFKGGKEVDRLIGAISKEALKEKIDSFLQ